METVIRVAIIYVAVLLGMRVLGKREFGQLSPVELVTLMLIPEIVSQSLIREDYSLTNSLIGVATLLTCVFLTSVLVHRFRSAEQFVEGLPAVLVAHGRIIEGALNRERISPDELFAEMHKAGLEKLHQVKWAVLEGDGQISIVPADPADRSRRGKTQSTTLG